MSCKTCVRKDSSIFRLKMVVFCSCIGHLCVCLCSSGIGSLVTSNKSLILLYTLHMSDGVPVTRVYPVFCNVDSLDMETTAI